MWVRKQGEADSHTGRGEYYGDTETVFSAARRMKSTSLQSHGYGVILPKCRLERWLCLSSFFWRSRCCLVGWRSRRKMVLTAGGIRRGSDESVFSACSDLTTARRISWPSPTGSITDSQEAVRKLRFITMQGSRGGVTRKAANDAATHRRTRDWQDGDCERGR